MRRTRAKAICLALWIGALAPAAVFSRDVRFTAPAEQVPLYGIFEVEVRVKNPLVGNPFTEAHLAGTFANSGERAEVEGFADSPDGTLFRIRFSPQTPGATYSYKLVYEDPAGRETFAGRFRCVESSEFRPVVIDPKHPKHFVHARSDRHFYHLGLTAYHLLDPSQSDEMVLRTIEYARRNGFNKIRFLLAGYPRDMPHSKTPADPEYGVSDPKRNYGAPDGTVNPLPVWVGKPHHYDFSRFNVAYWRKAERAIEAMRKRGIVATVIFTIEKQNLPREYGALTPAEYRFYRYGVARLAAFGNVWFDLGNEHNEYRDTKWGRTMGAFVHRTDPYGRLISAHAYEKWLYPGAPWAGWIITQQYGTPEQVNAWAVKYWNEPRPYVDEEYGYEGTRNKPGHGMNTDWVRRCHWAIATAGGYGTYGDHWKTAYYTGRPGRGKAPPQLHALKRFFEALPYWEMAPRNELVGGDAFCYAKPDEAYVVYCPNGGKIVLDLGNRADLHGRWFDPRKGSFLGSKHDFELKKGEHERAVECPGPGDWVLLLRRKD